MWHDPERRLEKAVERFEENDVETAWRMLRALERRGVTSPRIELYLGHCHLEGGRPEAAARRYRRAAELAPRRAEPWMGLGLAYGRTGLLRRARNAFRRAARLDPSIEEAHCQLVHCHVLLGEMDDAVRVAREVEKLDPECPHVHRHLAMGWLLLGRPAEALVAWRRVEARDAAHPELQTGLGRTLAALNRRVEARAAFARALERDPLDAGARVGLGDILWSEGRPAEALEHFRAAVAKDPDDFEARTRFVEALLAAGSAEEALEAVSPSLGSSAPGSTPPGSDPVSPVAVSLRARALRALGRRAEAVRELRALLVATDGSPGAWCALGEHLLTCGRPRFAAGALRRAVRGDPSRPEAARLLARALGRLGDRRGAVSTVARAARLHPLDEDLYVDTASALLARGRPVPAERALLRGLSWLPESPTLWAAAAEVAFDAGRPGEARTRLRAALRRDRRCPQALSLLTRWLVAREEWGKAAHAGRAAGRVLPGSDPAVREQGRALLRLSRAREALVPLRRYVLAAPADPEGYDLLAEALEAIGESAAASVQRRIARAVQPAA